MGLLDFLIDWMLPDTRRAWALLALLAALVAAAALLAAAILHLF